MEVFDVCKSIDYKWITWKSVQIDEFVFENQRLLVRTISSYKENYKELMDEMFIEIETLKKMGKLKNCEIVKLIWFLMRMPENCFISYCKHYIKLIPYSRSNDKNENRIQLLLTEIYYLCNTQSDARHSNFIEHITQWEEVCSQKYSEIVPILNVSNCMQYAIIEGFSCAPHFITNIAVHLQIQKILAFLIINLKAIINNATTSYFKIRNYYFYVPFDQTNNTSSELAKDIMIKLRVFTLTHLSILYDETSIEIENARVLIIKENL
jgi:hypothetical protein